MAQQSFDEHRISQARKIVSKINLPAQPTIVAEINKELNQEHPDFQNISKLVSQDASMAARVINVINSPFFGLARKVNSITQALTLMGLENFRKVILTACLQEKFEGANETDKVFWAHSVHTAVIAESLATSNRAMLVAEGVTPDQAYMAGLFHDISIPILLKRSADYAPFTGVAMSHKSDIIEEEDRLVGSDHCVVGGVAGPFLVGAGSGVQGHHPPPCLIVEIAEKRAGETHFSGPGCRLLSLCLWLLHWQNGSDHRRGMGCGRVGRES